MKMSDLMSNVKAMTPRDASHDLDAPSHKDKKEEKPN